MMADCCATDDSACTMLKMEFPELSSNDPDMNPDFCAMHGNVCTRCGNAPYTLVCVCLGLFVKSICSYAFTHLG